MKPWQIALMVPNDDQRIALEARIKVCLQEERDEIIAILQADIDESNFEIWENPNCDAEYFSGRISLLEHYIDIIKNRK